MANPNPVVHFEIIGQNGRQLQDFYAQLFGWKIDASNPMNYGMVEAGDGGIGGGIAAGDGQSHVTVYVQVADLGAALKTAESLGGKIVQPPMAVPGGPEIALFADPEGHVVGLVKEGAG